MGRRGPLGALATSLGETGGPGAGWAAVRAVVAGTAAAAAIIGCGQPGPLYLPGQSSLAANPPSPTVLVFGSRSAPR